MVPQTVPTASVLRHFYASGVSQIDVEGKSTPQNAPGEAISARSGSWALQAPPGAYGGIAAWHSGQAWFDALMDTLATPEGEELRRRAHVSRDTLLMVARADWRAADADTGRGLATAHETVAAALGMSSKTVQRSRDLLVALGFAVTIVEGRYLTLAERRAAREFHGGRQLRAASLRALTMPRPSDAVRNVQLPHRGSVLPKSHVKKLSPTRASARKTAAPRPPANTKITRRAMSPTSTHATERTRPLALQKLAADLMRRLRWLDTGRHIGSLCNVLEGAGLDPDHWTARGVMDAMDRFVRSRGITYPDHTRNPLGFLRWILSQAELDGQETPESVASRISAERRERLEAWKREREEAQRIRESIDRDEVARIIARSNAEIAEMNRRRKERRDG